MSEKKYKEVEPENNIWKPEEEGAEIEGTVLEVNDGAYGLQLSINSDGKEIKTPSHKVLQNRLNSIKAGDEIKIVFTGEEPPSLKGNNPTRMYKVFVAE